MALETTEWKITDHLREDPEAIFYYLEAELEKAEPPYAARALRHVIEVRGGVEKLAAETGLSVAVLQASTVALDTVDRETLTKVMEAFRPQAETSTKVA
jgi:DNA-binding phage protein